MLLVGGGNDLLATHFHLSINAITWFVRILFFVGPVLAFFVTKRICLGLQRRDRTRCCTAGRPAPSSACRTVSSSRSTSR